MYYLWHDCDCPNKLMLEYDKNISPDRFIFFRSNEIKPEQVRQKIVFKAKVSKKLISQFDCAPNNSGSPLVNQKVAALLLRLAPDEVQFFEADIYCTDGILQGYQLLNCTRKFIGVDYEKSKYRTILPDDDDIGSFKRLSFKPGSMGSLHIARMEEFSSHIVVNEEIKQAFASAKFKGVDLDTPEDYYGSIYIRG